MNAALSAPAPSVRVKRTILGPDARKLLTDFIQNVTDRPTVAQRQVLIQQIRSMSKNYEFYQETSLQQWFNTQRKKNAAKAASSSEYPTLTAKSIEFLVRLLQPLPDPPPDTIRTWADLLQASPEDITAWIQAHRPSIVPPRPSSHLPTPAESQSPEPMSAHSYRSSPEFKSESSSSSPLVAFAPPPKFLIRMMSPELSPKLQPAVFSRMASPATPKPPNPLLSALSQILHRGIDVKAGGHAPSSAADFNAAFAEYEADIERTLGVLRYLEPSLSHI